MEDNQPGGQGGVPCPKCGTLVAPGDRFCLNCGTGIPVQEGCPSCGNPLEEGAKFCQFCGEPVIGGTTDTPAPISPEPEREGPSAAPVRIKKPEKKLQVPVAETRDPTPSEKSSVEKSPSFGKDPLAFPERDREKDPNPEVPPVPDETSQKKGRKKARKPGKSLKYVAVGILVLVIIGISGFVLLSGNPGSGLTGIIAPTPTPTPSPTPTPEPTPEEVVTELPTTLVPTPTPEPTLSLEPEATDTLPAGTDVSINVDPIKSPSDASVTVIFNGGPGMRAISVCNVTLVRSDGQVVSGKLDTTKVGSELSLQGTRGTDRVIVYVTQWTGKTYKIIDQTIGYR